MFIAQKPIRPALRIGLWLVVGVLLVLAIVLRISLYHVETSDYSAFLGPWYNFIHTHGGFAALKYNFSNYNVPYLYLLALMTYLPIPQLVAIKTLSVVFDALLGLFTYLILRMRFEESLSAAAGVLVVLFAPTVFLNSAAWGQCDAIYTAFCLGSLYFLLKERPLWACIFFGLAISFKLQAIFFLPVLLIAVFCKRLPLKYLALIPLVFLLLLVPAFIAGRDVPSLLSIYVGQVSSGGTGGGTAQFGGNAGFNRGNGAPRQFPAGGFNRGGETPGQPPTGTFNGTRPSGQFQNRGAGGFGNGGFNGNRGGFRDYASSLTLNAPSFYQWLPADAASYWKWIGIVLAGLFSLGVALMVRLSKKPLTTEILLKLSLACVLTIPFLLPEMHERYFFMADVISIIYAFCFPRKWYVPVIVVLCSLLSYAPYFLNTQVVSLSYVAFAEFIAVLIVVIDLALTLYPPHKRQDGVPSDLTSSVPGELQAIDG